MRALRLNALKSADIIDAPVPTPLAGERVLRVLRCGLCRTDAKCLFVGQRDLVLPRIPGHEIVAEDEASGARYALWPGESCGVCECCASGHENLCAEMRIHGFHKDGGLAGYVAAPESALIPLPEGLNPALGTLMEPMACGLNALAMARVERNDRLLIYGGGPAGLLMAWAALTLHGALPVIVENNPRRIALAATFASSAGIELEPAPPAEITYDVIINAAPGPEIIISALDILRPCGRLCLFSGLLADPVHARSILNEIHYRQLTITGAYGCTRRHMRDAGSFLASRMETAKLLPDGEIGLAEAPEALAAIWRGDGLKCIVDPWR